MMSDMLSQDEIDALLRGADAFEPEESSDVHTVNEYLSSLEQDALGEIGNISFGSSATALSTLLNQKVEITTPTVSVVNRQKLSDEFPQPYVAIKVNYTEGFDGLNLLVIKTQDASIIADLMLGGDGLNPSTEMNEIHLSAVQEAMNQMMGSAATSMSTIFNKRVDISPPTIDILDVRGGAGTTTLPEQDELIRISFRLKVGELIDSNIMQLLPVHFAKELVNDLLNPSSSGEMVTPSSVSTPTPLPNTAHQQSKPMSMTEEASTQPTVRNGHTGYDEQPYQYQSQSQIQELPPKNVQVAEFSDFSPSASMIKSESRNLDMLLDIPLQVTVELGRTKRTVKDILELSSGSIIELDKLAGEPVDILVNNKLIAKGEVVVIDENFGVRVTDIISQSDRIMKLR